MSKHFTGYSILTILSTWRNLVPSQTPLPPSPTTSLIPSIRHTVCQKRSIFHPSSNPVVPGHTPHTLCPLLWGSGGLTPSLKILDLPVVRKAHGGTNQPGPSRRFTDLVLQLGNVIQTEVRKEIFSPVSKS